MTPAYIAALRGSMPTAQLMTMVQLSQACPGWWRDLSELGQEIGLNIHTLTKHVNWLERNDLIRCHRISGKAPACWLWWVKRSVDDRPHSKNEPAWVVMNTKTGMKSRVTLSRRAQWAAGKGIPGPYLSSLLYGHRELIYNEWRLVSSPLQSAL